MNRTRKTGEFKAKSADGKEFVICIHTMFAVTSVRGEGKQPPTEEENAVGRSLRTPRGTDVEYIDKGHYRIGLIEVFSDDPAAV